MPGGEVADYAATIQNPALDKLWWGLIASAVVAMICSFLIDANEFSLSMLYANRLTRCYLGGTRRPPNSAENSDTVWPGEVMGRCGGPIR